MKAILAVIKPSLSAGENIKNIQPVISEKMSTTSFIFAQLALAIFAFHTYYTYIALGEPVKWLHLFFADDTYYYLKIAENFFKYGYFTFDGIDKTNGFQPLWMIVLIGLKAAIGSHDLLVSTMTLCMALHCINSILFGNLIRSSADSRIWGLAAQTFFLGNILLLKANLLLMENTLAYTLVLMISMRVQRGSFLTEKPAQNGHLINGFLLAAFVLCRVDYAIVVAFFGLMLLAMRRSLLSREVMQTFAPPAISLFTLGCLNLLYFGHAGLISGEVKRIYVSGYLSTQHGWGVVAVYAQACISLARTIYSITLQAFIDSIRLHTRDALFGLGIVGLISAACFFVSKRKKEIHKSRRMIIILCCAALVHALSMIAYLPIFIMGSQWYFSLESIAVMTVLIIGMRAITSRFRIEGMGILVLALSLQLAFSMKDGINYEARMWQPDPTSDRSMTYQMAQYIYKNLPADAVIGSSNAGVLGYYSNRRVINLDGLVNDFDYYSKVLSSPKGTYPFPEYAKRKGIGYLADYEICQTCTDNEILEHARPGGIDFKEMTLLKTLKSNQSFTARDNSNREVKGMIVRTAVYLVQLKQ